ncbi:MAG: hypothetical protein ACRD12_19365 [Acidimicrobiales bacterium]
MGFLFIVTGLHAGRVGGVPPAAAAPAMASTPVRCMVSRERRWSTYPQRCHNSGNLRSRSLSSQGSLAGEPGNGARR